MAVKMEKVEIKRDSLVKELTKKVRDNSLVARKVVCLFLKNPQWGTAAAPVLKNREQQEAMLGVGAEAEVLPEGLR